MKNVYFIAAHHKPYQFEWIYSTIPENAHIFVHVDSKAGSQVNRDITRIARSRGNATLMDRRPVSWSGWTQVANELRAMRLALKKDDWKYFIYLSGQCYPTKSAGETEHTLSSAWPNNFIRCWTFEQVQDLEADDPHLQRTAYLDIGGRIRKLPFKLPRTSLDVDYKGSTWHALTREFCAWVVESKASKRIARYLRHSFCPDEIFFQASIMNSPFRERRMSDAARHFVFPGPKTMRLHDLDDILASDSIYARKFDANVDRSVLEGLAQKLGYPVLTAATLSPSPQGETAIVSSRLNQRAAV